MSFLDTQAKNQRAGNMAGYVLDFHKIAENGHIDETPLGIALSVSSDNYFTKIEASMPSGFAAGRYVFEIEGLTDADYAQIAQANKAGGKVIKFYLYWGDVISGFTSYFTNFIKPGSLSEEDKPSAIVAVLQVVGVSRYAGENRYITKVEAIERVFFQCRENTTPPTIVGVKYRDALTQMAQTAIIDVDIYPSSGDITAPATDSGSEAFTGVGESIAKSIRTLGERVEQSANKHGREPLLIRDGKLVFGIRSVPYPLGTEAKDLLASNGLIKVEVTGTVAADPFSQFASDTPPAPDPNKPVHPQFTMLLKGRPDLKPGDMVRFDLAEEETGKTEPGVGAALLGSFSGAFAATETILNPTFAYVDSVLHRLGRTQGFVTTLTCTGVEFATDSWDIYTDAPTGTDSPSPPPAADPAVRAANAISKLSKTSERRTGLEVGEVRSFVANSATEPTSQTEVAWCGLVNADGRPNQSRRLPVSRQFRIIKDGIPYVSPFAWGKCGLILPRYPGMRIAVGYRNGDPHDAMDIGGVFETGKTSTEAQPGDYWLSLPAKVPSNERQQIGEADTPKDYTDVVSNDLIDADGHRVIEVGELTIRVNELASLKKAGARPARGTANAITIEHAKGAASIVIKDNGEITITGKKITFDAGSGDIIMKANKVDVTVQSEMNVK